MMQPIHQIVLKLVAPCNLNCNYCYVYNGEDKGFRSRPKTISNDVFDAVLARINEYCEKRENHSFSIGFHGGEPTLIGVERFQALVNRARFVLGRNLHGLALQTNGTLIDDSWAQAIRELRVAPSVSLDGPHHIHDARRVDHSGRGSHAATVRGIRAIQRVNLVPNILCVVNPYESGLEAYQYFRSLDLRVIDFLLPDVSHDNYAAFYGDLGPTPVANYLIPVLDAWLDEDDPDVKVLIFWGLFKRLLGGESFGDGFGNKPSGYLVIETDGSIEANDALRVCEDGISRSSLNVLNNGFDDLNDGLPLFEKAVSGGFPLPTGCRSCPERGVCGGGYLPHRYSRESGFDNPSVWCADIIKLLGYMRLKLADADSAVGVSTTA